MPSKRPKGTISASDFDLSRRSQRLKYARRFRGYTQTQLAESVGIKQGNYSRLETKDDIVTSQLGKIGMFLKINLIWLETGQGDMLRLPVDPKVAVVLAYNPKGDPDPEGDLLVMTPWQLTTLGNPDPETLLIHYATDALMEPGIKINSLKLIDTTRTSPESGEIYLLNISGTPYLRRLIDDYGRWRLVADATPGVVKYLDEVDAKIIGRVIW